jgi:hypothetical protein
MYFSPVDLTRLPEYYQRQSREETEELADRDAIRIFIVEKEEGATSTEFGCDPEDTVRGGLSHIYNEKTGLLDVIDSEGNIVEHYKI